MKIFSILICNIKKALAPKSITDPAKKLLIEYHNFLDVFSQTVSDILPLQRLDDHKILLMEEKSPSGGLL